MTTSSAGRARPARRLIASVALASLAVPGLALGAAGASSRPASKPKPPPFSSLEKSLQAEEKLTFKVVYSTYGSGSTQALTFEQKPPDARFGTAQGFVLQLGAKTYFCETAAGHPICLKSGGASPLLGLEGLFSPAAVVTELKSLQSEVAAKLAGVKVATSSKSFAGQASTCITVSAKGKGYEYCVTNSTGILAYGGSGSSYLEMTSYSSSAPAGDFALPKGATITGA